MVYQIMMSSKTQNSVEIIFRLFFFMTFIYEHVTRNQSILTMLACQSNLKFVQQQLKEIDSQKKEPRFLEIELEDEYEEIMMIERGSGWSYCEEDVIG
jgi:hypothetical protein